MNGLSLKCPTRDLLENKKRKSSSTLQIKSRGRRASVERISKDKGGFDDGRSIKELAALQKVKPIKDMAALAGGIPDDEDVDELVKEIYAARK
jgi:hypothetical protein